MYAREGGYRYIVVLLHMMLTVSCGFCFTSSGETVITDHVRSIVRECLQEADVQFISSQEPDINANYHDNGYKELEQASDDRNDQVPCYLKFLRPFIFRF